jgi:hypothetical protein
MIANNGCTDCDKLVGESIAMCAICIVTLGTVTYREMYWQNDEYYYSCLRDEDEA